MSKQLNSRRYGMLRVFFTDKWIIGGATFLIILAVGCIFWYRYDTAADRKASVETAELLHQQENTQRTNANNMTEDETNTPGESKNQSPEKLSTETIDDTLSEDTVSSEINPNLTEQAQESRNTVVRVSPHGFGPYPDIPSDYPSQDVWDYPDDISAEAELLLRVQIKLWKQGTRSLGGIMRNGLVYPTILGVVYVEWKQRRLSDGTIEKIASDMRGDPHKGRILMSIKQRKGELTESDIPEDITVININEGGIDPLQFLNLK